jgi:hypothetical protein
VKIHLAAFLVGVVYYTAGFLAFWLGAAPYAKNLGAGAFADGLWAELFPYWAFGQIALTAWVCFIALGLPAARHRALAAGLGAGLLSLLGLLALGVEDVARAALDVLGVLLGVVLGLFLDRVARTTSPRLPAAWHLVWLWIPAAAFLASALVLINSIFLSFIVEAVSTETLWLALPLLGGVVMAAGWWRLAQATTMTRARTANEMLGALLVVAGAAAPALITGFVFRGLFLREVAGFG